jgi:rhodanese-related sulfurtransferase
MKVRVRRELISMHCDDVDPVARTGVHVDAAEWNRLLDDPDVTVVDARNGYEIELGTFPGAIDPGTRSFREFPRFADALDLPHRKIAMFYRRNGLRKGACIYWNAVSSRLSTRRRYSPHSKTLAATVGGSVSYRSTRIGRRRSAQGDTHRVTQVAQR